MEKENYTRAWLILFAIILALAFAFQGSRGLWRADEGRYVRCAYEMLKTGNWVTPQINFKPHFTKPPMTYWLIASGLSIFGMNEWGARASHALAFALTAMMVAYLGKRMWGNREGLAAGLIYATTIVPFAAGNAVTADTILTLFETLALLCFWMSVSVRADTPKASLWALGMWAAFGLAFLTKGPAGLIPLVVIIAYLLIRKGGKRLPASVTVLGIGLFAAIALPWYLAVIREHKGLLDYFLKHEVVGRVFTGEHHRNAQWFGPVAVYLPVLTAGALPWAVFWPVFLRRSRPSVFTFEWWKRLRQRPIALFLLLWFGIPLFVLSLSSSRLQLYVLPIFAPLALATAHGLVRYYPEWISRACQLRGKPVVAIAILFVLLLSSKSASAYLPVRRDTRAMWNGISKTIHAKVGDEPYEIVLLHQNYDGLAFYSQANVEAVRTIAGKPSFVPNEHVKEEYDELALCHYTHVFLTEGKYVGDVLKELQKRGVRYSVEQAPFGSELIFCEGAPRVHSVVRLAALGDTGTGHSDQAMLDSALYQLDQNTTLDGIILLGDNIVGWKGSGDPPRAYQEYFEEPYGPLLKNGVKFYAVLGNHDLSHSNYQTCYPHFNMGGKRYYSKVFGDNVVEVFFLDSNTIRDDAQQIAWLKQALGQSTADWRVVATHVPLYSTARAHKTQPSMVEVLEPIFTKYGVDIVLSGHSHVYQRLRPVHGIHYIIAGSGGKLSTHDLIPNDPDRIAGNDEENVFVVLQFERETCHLTAYSLNEEIVDKAEISHASASETAAISAGAVTSSN